MITFIFEEKKFLHLKAFEKKAKEKT